MRKVEVAIGIPDDLADPEDKGLSAMQDCYCINFTPDNEGEPGFSAHGSCICSLSKATEAWLNGATIAEVQAVVGTHEHDEEEEDNPPYPEDLGG